MLTTKEINPKDFELCFELDLDVLSLWNKKQWEKEFTKKGTKVIGLMLSNDLIGICVFQVVLDEAQINYFAIKREFRRQGFGTFFMENIMQAINLVNVNKMYLEVSEKNLSAEKFYNHLGFTTLGIRKRYYKDGSNALLKEKNLQKIKNT